MGLSKKILNIALAIIDVLTFFIHPKKGRILFNSLTQKELSSDFKLIYEALEKEGKYDLRTNLLVFEKNLKGDFHECWNGWDTRLQTDCCRRPLNNRISLPQSGQRT